MGLDLLGGKAIPADMILPPPMPAGADKEDQLMNLINHAGYMVGFNQDGEYVTAIATRGSLRDDSKTVRRKVRPGEDTRFACLRDLARMIATDQPR